MTGAGHPFSAAGVVSRLDHVLSGDVTDTTPHPQLAAAITGETLTRPADALNLIAHNRACHRALVRGRWEPGLIIGHNDAAPVTQEWDLAFTAFAWVPLHARQVVRGEGFTAFADRPRRLRHFLDTYGWHGSLAEFVSTVQARVTASAEGIQRTAAAGDSAYQRMLGAGVDASLRTAVRELEDFRSHLDT